MGQKKKILTLCICIIVITFALMAIPVNAGGFHTVRGDIYINGKLASESSIDNVKISFPSGDGVDNTSSTGHYEINFQGHDWEDGYFYVYYSGSWHQPNTNKTIEIDPDIIGYYYDLYITVESPPPPPPPPPEEPVPPSGPINLAPVADASLSEKTGFIGISVYFDGSKSTDSDGTITEYAWNFGDGKTGNGITTTHIYTAEGVYSVTLTVKDNVGAVGFQTFNVIISIPNNPPDAPVISGPTMGTKDETYDYTFISIDVDDDDLSYNISWGDTETSTTAFYPNATEATSSHSWDMAGVYTINAHAYDNKTVSGTTKYVVLIDAWWVKDIGYLLDYDADGVYEKFYSNSTDEETNTEQREDGKYLIDEDGDGEWDWVYDTETDTLTAYVPAKEEEQDYTLWYVLILIIIIILIIIAYLATKRKKKPQETKPETKNNTDKNSKNKKKK